MVPELSGAVSFFEIGALESLLRGLLDNLVNSPKKGWFLSMGGGKVQVERVYLKFIYCMVMYLEKVRLCEKVWKQKGLLFLFFKDWCVFIGWAPC